MNKPLIIGFSGKMGSGKDYIAKEVLGNYLKTRGIQYIHMAFGDALKVELMVTHNIKYDELYIKKTTETRKLLQTFGMEKRKINDNIWINYLDSWITIYGMRGINVVLISDVRFPIEYNYIKEKGGIVFRIISPQRTLKRMEEETDGDNEKIDIIRNHISETGLDDYDISIYDGVIYNDTSNIEYIMNIILSVVEL